MKYLFSLLTFITLSAQAQWGLYQIMFSPDVDWQTFRWEVEYKGEIIAFGGAGGHPGYTFNGSQNAQTDRFFAPNDCVKLRIIGATYPLGPSIVPSFPSNVFCLTRVLPNNSTQPIIIHNNSVCLFPNNTQTPVEYYTIDLSGNGGPCTPDEPCTDCLGDLNGDGIVGSADVLIMNQRFGATCP